MSETHRHAMAEVTQVIWETNNEAPPHAQPEMWFMLANVLHAFHMVEDRTKVPGTADEYMFLSGICMFRHHMAIDFLDSPKLKLVNGVGKALNDNKKPEIIVP